MTAGEAVDSQRWCEMQVFTKGCRGEKQRKVVKRQSFIYQTTSVQSGVSSMQAAPPEMLPCRASNRRRNPQQRKFQRGTTLKKA